MEIAIKYGLPRGAEREAWERFLVLRGLRPDADVERVALAYEGDRLVACGALYGRVLKQIAVDPAFEGGGACASVVSALVGEAYLLNRTHLFLFTKPENERMFASLGFYPLAHTSDMLMTENRRLGLSSFLDSMERFDGVCGAIVMNANPFTNGHRCLVEYASRNCDALYVFVLSEESGFMRAEERVSLVRAGTADIANCHVYESADYLVSRATFPTYFIKDAARLEDARAELDLALFGQRIAPALHIQKRFVGTEPFCRVTRAYNAQMKRILPQYGVKVIEIERKDKISASRVRKLMAEGDLDGVRALVPNATYEWAKTRLTGAK